jgi:hypothetical protein
MSSPLSVDLRGRVVAAVAAGAIRNRAAARFPSACGASTAAAGTWPPKPMSGDHTSQAIEADAELIPATSEQRPRLFLRAVGAHRAESRHSRRPERPPNQ